MPESDNNPSLARVRTSDSPPLRDCERRFTEIEDDIKEIKIILIGADGRDGIVADLNTMLYRDRNISILVQIVLSIAASVITAMILKVI